MKIKTDSPSFFFKQTLVAVKLNLATLSYSVKKSESRRNVEKDFSSARIQFGADLEGTFMYTV